MMYAWPLALLIPIVMREMVLSLRWNWTYFSVGLRVFHRVLPVLDPKATTPSEERLEEAVYPSAFPPLAFWAIEQDRFAFREKISGGLRLGYLPVMRGNLLFKRRGVRVEVVGLLNWSVLAFLGAAAYSVWVLWTPLFLILTALLCVVTYAIQFRRFSQVLRAAAQVWSLRPDAEPRRLERI
jgi:hypothetical protein